MVSLPEHLSPVVSFGELLIDFVPSTNGLHLSDVPTFHRVAGGAPANVACAISRLGGRARMISKVGQDAFGDFLHQTLANEGVDVAQTLLRTPDARTGLAFVSLRADGERDFLFYRSPAADMMIRAEEVTEAMVADASIFHFGSVSLVSEPSRQATRSAVARAHKCGALISYDPNVRLNLWPDAIGARHLILDLMEHAHLVKLSEEEVVFLTDETDIALGVQTILAHGPRVVVVTLGSRGCRLFTAQHDIFVPGFAVQAIDATGAGDGFVGGLLYRIAMASVTPQTITSYFDDDTLSVATLQFANAVGALATTRRGAIPALPTLSEVQTLLDRTNTANEKGMP